MSTTEKQRMMKIVVKSSPNFYFREEALTGIEMNYDEYEDEGDEELTVTIKSGR